MKSRTWEFSPSPDLREYIKKYRYLKEVFCGVYRCLPTTDLQIYFSFSNITIQCSQGLRLKNPEVFITGFHDQDQIIRTDIKDCSHNSAFIIIMQPTGFYQLFGTKACEFVNCFVRPELCYQSRMEDLWSEMRDMDDPYEMKMIVESFFKELIFKRNNCQDLVNEVFKYINKRKGILRIKDICENFNTTPRSLQRAFKEETGLSPKDILNLRRMNYAVELITEDRNLHLAELSQMCGFYDQSHFTKEIKKRTGFKPSTIISRNEKVYRNMSKIHFFKS